MSRSKEIEGLRAIAVISIILFHLDFKYFSGGFVGVDVFFVISGYLITRLIRDEVLGVNAFNYSQFYTRRARRLFPSLFFTLCLSFIFAFLFFSQQDFQRFSGALATSALGLSNFFFWSESGYFDVAADTKPLLHTWALSVQEQFYLLWPLLIVFCLTKIPHHKQRLSLLILGISSLFINYVFTRGFVENFSWLPLDITNSSYKYYRLLFPSTLVDWLPADGPSTIFYLMPFRVFEFAIGSVLVWLVHLRPKEKLTTEVFILVGLAMILYPINTYTGDIIFPSYNALLPCFGTALIIHSGTTQYAGRLLNNPISVGIGRISYSLYLIHWPIIVFYKHWKSSELIITEQLAIFFCSIVAATLMYQFIEQPFREKGPSSNSKVWSGPMFGFACIALSLIVVFLSASIKTDGWSWRPGVVVESKESIAFGQMNGFWNLKADEKYDFLIVGNSFAGHLYDGFEKVSQESLKNFTVFETYTFCSIFLRQKNHVRYNEYNCEDRWSNFKDFIVRNKIKRIIIASNWQGSTTQKIINGLKTFLSDKRLAGLDIEIMMILNLPQFYGGLSLSKCNIPDYLQKNKHDNHCMVNEDRETNDYFRDWNKEIKKATYPIKVVFIDPFEAFCSSIHCKNQINGQRLFLDDGTHLTKFGSIYLAEYFKSQILWFLLNSK